MPCQVVRYPTSFLQAIQTGQASPGALPLTTAPHNCSALRPFRTAPEMWWLSAGLRRSSENVPLLWADLEQGSAATPLCSELKRCCEPAAAASPRCTIGLLSAVLQMWQVCQHKASSIGTVSVKSQFIQENETQQQAYSTTGKLPCVKERLSSEDLNFCRLSRASPKSYRFPLELCVRAIAWNREIGYPL